MAATCGLKAGQIVAFWNARGLQSSYEEYSWVHSVASANLAECRKLEINMKKIALAAALSVAASTAFAGGVAEPTMEPEVVKAATSSSAGGIIVPLLLLLVVAAAVSSN